MMESAFVWFLILSFFTFIVLPIVLYIYVSLNLDTHFKYFFSRKRRMLFKIITNKYFIDNKFYIYDNIEDNERNCDLDIIKYTLDYIYKELKYIRKNNLNIENEKNYYKTIIIYKHSMNDKEYDKWLEINYILGMKLEVIKYIEKLLTNEGFLLLEYDKYK